MKELFFWKVWSRSERGLAIGGLVVLFFSLLFLAFKMINPLANVIRWDVLSELSTVNSVIDVLRLDQWQFGVSVPSQLVSEQFVASTMETDFLTVKIFWILSMTGLSLVLAAITTLSRFWYLAAMIAFILLTASARPETLGLFGEANRSFFIIIVILIGGLSYYFHAFRPDLGIGMRIAGLLGVMALLAVVVAFLSPAKYPGLTAASYAEPFWLLLTIIFLLMISTEIMAGLVWLSTNGQTGKGKSGLWQFLVISVLYVVSVLLLYLRNTKQIDWNLTLVSPIYLALISGLLGLWGFKRRADSTQGLIPFRSTGFWLYMGLFIISIAFAIYAAGTANDPLLEVLEDVTVNSQLAMNIVFLFYVLINFYQPIKQGLAVHKVLYKPFRFGLTQTRFFGFVGVVVLFSMQRLYPVYQGIAGYFNGLGDLYANNGEFPLAEQYYKMALQQDFQNHKSNYALASLALRLGDDNAAAYYFRQSLLKNPSPQAYAGLTGVLVKESLFFDAVYSLQEGIRKFPESGELLNNLGMLYARTNVADSAFYYLDRSVQYTKREEVPATNLLAIMAKSTDAALLDSLASGSKEQSYLSWQANWLAIQNIRQKFAKQVFNTSAVPKDSLLSVSGIAYLANYAMNQAKTDSLPAAILPKLAARNQTVSDNLIFASLYPEFYSGNKLKALETLFNWVKEGGEKAPVYRKVLGHWLLQLGLYHKAIEQFSTLEGAEGTIGLAVANALDNKTVEAEIILDHFQEKEKDASVSLLKKTLLTGVKPRSNTDSLLAVARKSPTDRNFDAAVRSNPFSEQIVSAASDYYRQKKQTKKAYDIVLDAMRLNETSPLVWEQYTYLSVEQGLLGQADEGEAQVKEFSTPAGYQQFVTRYQPMRALIEKQRAEFQ
jgi:tetratricopeptide (TPR) repeat protein